jgi:O-antigen/teichoic acid export membrane protein
MRIVVPRGVRELGVRIGLLVVYLLYAKRILSLDGFVIALCVNYAIASIVNLCYFLSLKHIKLRPDWAFLRANKSIVRRYLTYTGFLVISALTTVLAPILSSLFITAEMGLNSTGIFAIATYIAVMVSIPNRSVTAIASPQLARAIKEQNREECSLLIQQVTRNLLLIGGFILLAIWVNIDLIFHIMPNGETFATAKIPVLLLGVSQLILGTFYICLNALNFSRYYAFSLLLSAILTVSAILLNRYLVPQYQMTGAAASNLLSFGLYYLLICITVVALCRLKIVDRNWWLIMILIATVFVLNWLWMTYLPSFGIWTDSILRSIVLLGGACFLAYKMKLSPEINGQLSKTLNLKH